MALTKVAGDILDPGISIAGVVTATAFDGPFRGGSSSDVTAGIGTFTELDVNGSADFSGNVTIGGSFTVQGDHTTLNTTLRNVELLRVATNSATTAGIITQTGAGDILNLFDGTSEVLTVLDTGEVGIGTITPSTPLHILSNSAGLRIQRGNQSLAVNANYGGAEHCALEFTGALSLFPGGGSEKLRITSAGNVGIGTVVPAATLETYKSGTSGYLFRAMAGLTVGNRPYDLKPPSSNSTTEPFSWNTGNAHAFQVDGNEKLRITDSGKVGVNTSTPPQQFTSYAASGYPILAQGTSNGIGLGGNGAIVFGTNDLGSYAKGILDATELEIKVSGTPKITIDTSGRLRVANTNFSASSDGDTVVIGTTSGTRGISIISGNNNTGNIFFGDDGDNDIGGVVYNHNGDTLDFRANGLTRATVSATAFWVDDGTNARLKLAPDGASLNMIISTTTNNGSYCNLLYGAADHIFKYGGTETARLSTTGNYTITGEYASAQNYPTIRPTLDLNFAAVKKLDPRITFYGRAGGGSYVDKYGIVQIVGPNVPRFHHDPETRESKGLLIEPNVANWIKHGTNWDTGPTAWGVNGTTHTLAPTVVAPDGKTGGVWEQKETSSNAYHASYYNGNVPLTDTQYYSISSWVKKGPNYRTDINSGRYQFYCTRGTGSVAYVSIDSTFTSITNHSNTTSRSITQYPNGWVRVTFSFQANATISNAQAHWLLGNGGSYAGNGASSVYVWGCQMEQLIYPTTYIHTDGSVVYRGTESCVIDGTDFSDFYNTEESSLYVEGNIHVPTSYAGQYNIVHIGDSNADGHGIFRESGSKDAWYHLRSSNSTPSGGNLNPSGYGDWGDGQSEAKIAIAFKSGDQAISVNGGNQVTATVSSGYPSANISKMWIGASGDSGAGTFSGTISRITYYPKQLTDAQLNILTA